MKPFNLTLFLLTGFLAGCPQEKDSDELIQALSQRESAIVKISAYTALGNLPALETELNAALDNGMSVNEIKEILIVRLLRISPKPAGNQHIYERG